MSKKLDKLSTIVAPAVEALGYELLGCEYLSQGHNSVLRVFIDSEKGVGLEDCQNVSHQVSAVLDVEEPLSGTYSLEVSSPGMERPLFTLEHFKQFLGEKVKIHLEIPLNNRRNFEGMLKEANEELVVVDVDHELFMLPFSDIDKANLVPDFDFNKG